MLSSELRAVYLIRKYVSSYQLKKKQDSWHQKLIGKAIGVFNKTYLTSFYTTFGATTYIPSSWSNAWEWEVLLHEGRHAIQAKKLSMPVFAFLYGFPAILAPVFALMALFFSPWWLIGAVVSMLPLPAVFRAWFEFEAYCVTMAVAYWENPSQVDDTWIRNQLVPNFTGPNYYFMFPFKTVEERFKKFREKLISGEALKDEYLKSVYALCEILQIKGA